MKKIAILLCIFSLISCEQVIGEIIENSFENQTSDYDTFLKIENNSGFLIENIEIITYSAIYINKLNSHQKTDGFGVYSIISDPSVSFYINNTKYEYKSTTPIVRIDAGNYILKINILPYNPTLFTTELILDSE